MASPEVIRTINWDASGLATVTLERAKLRDGSCRAALELVHADELLHRRLDAGLDLRRDLLLRHDVTEHGRTRGLHVIQPEGLEAQDLLRRDLVQVPPPM